MSYLVPSEVTLIDSPGDYKYIGVASSGSSESADVWKILRIKFSNGEAKAVEWADGNASSDNKWSERLAKVYS